MSSEKAIEQKEIVVERTPPNVLAKMYDYYTENYRYFLHKDQMNGLDVKPTSMNNFNGNKRVPKGKTFKPITKRQTFKTRVPRVPKPLPQKVEYLKREFEFLESKALNESANDHKFYDKMDNWIHAHEGLSQWEMEKIYSYRVPENILMAIIEKTGNKFTLKIGA